MPQMNQHFEVDQPVRVVWDFFQDMPQVVECMLGVELTEKGADDVYMGKMKIKLGGQYGIG